MSATLKLLVVGIKWPPETFLQRLFRGLAEAGMEVTIVCGRKPDKAWMAHRNIHWLLTSEWQSISTPFNLAKWFCAALIKGYEHIQWVVRQAHQANRIIDRLYLYFRWLPFAGKRWDIIYFPWNYAAMESLPLFDLGAAVVSCRGAQINIAPLDPDRKGMIEQLRTIFEKVAAVHCVSEAIKKEAMQYGLDPAKAWVIRPAVDPDFFCPGAQPKIKDSTFRIITVGSIIWRKGYEYALLGVRRLLDRGVAAELHIIGDGPEWARLLYTIGDLNLEKRVYLYGRLSPEAVRSRLQQADVFLLASLSEGVSNAVLEAMACGLPVVTTDCGGMREAVTEEVEGLVVPIRDPEAIAMALARLDADAALRSRLGQAARTRILENFTLDQQIIKFRTLFLENSLQCE